MPDTISSKFRLMVPHGELRHCIAFLEDGLRSLKRTPYHRVLGRDFLSQSADLGAWIAGFARKAHAEKVKLKALYLRTCVGALR